MTNLRSTQPHFVRCIIPNETKTPGNTRRNVTSLGDKQIRPVSFFEPVLHRDHGSIHGAAPAAL